MQQSTITLAGGCFWCFDAVYRRVRGVSSSLVGYAGGHMSSPTYEQVIRGVTGHAESVQITFDPKIINADHILNLFWSLHDPTSLNRQGADKGPQYRSALFYTSDDQRKLFELSKQRAQAYWNKLIVTEIVPLERFYPAEDYHQDYFNKHPEQGYCQIVINPKIIALRQSFAHLLEKLDD